MRVTLGTALLILAAGVFAMTPAVGVQPTVGLIMNDGRASEGYVLFGPPSTQNVYLLSNDGLQVHVWNTGRYPGEMGYLLENGHLLRAGVDPDFDPRFNGGIGRGGFVEEYDWDGNLLWTFRYSDSLRLAHHDIEPLPNGNVLVVAWEYKTRAQAIAAGRSPASVPTALWPDHVIEVRPTPPSGGEIVWEWHLWDHLVQAFDPTKPNFGVPADHPELVDLNYAVHAGEDWNHVNTIRYDPSFDQIILCSRYFFEFWVIDHGTTTELAAGHTGGRYGKGGDILYRWGNPLTYRRGTPADVRLFHPHDAQWIATGVPGAGHILVFNNGTGRPGGDYSSIDEIVPPVDANGNYSILPGAPFGPASAVWSYTATPPTDLYSVLMSGTQRQPDGNTLICVGTGGTFLEVTSDKAVVWKYVNPMRETGPIRQGDPPTGNNVFKIRRYAPDYPGLVGRTLTPGDPIEGFDRPFPAPDGSLLASRASYAGDQVQLNWNASSCPTNDYNLIFGNLADVSSYALLGAQCSIGTGGNYLWAGVPAASVYFIVVGRDETGIYESSWGRNSSADERHGTRASFLCGTVTKVVTSTCP